MNLERSISMIFVPNYEIMLPNFEGKQSILAIHIFNFITKLINSFIVKLK